MISTDVIINNMFRAVGERNTTTPTNRFIPTRTEMLLIINQLYQEEIGELVKSLASFSYDSSDAAHTITAGVGPLPTDYLKPHRVYDGDTPDQKPLTQIRHIEDKVADTEVTSQYMIPDNTNLWIFGTTPTDEIKMYYFKRPVALTDAANSYPVALKAEFHRDGIFEARAKKVHALRRNKMASYNDLLALEQGFFAEIAKAHTIDKMDDAVQQIEDVYGW